MSPKNSDIGSTDRYIMPKNNPIVLLLAHYKNAGPIVSILTETRERALIRLLGQNYLGGGFHALASINSPVLTSQFSDRFYAIFKGRRISIVRKPYEIKEQDDGHGSLLIFWQGMPVKTTRHHIIPHSRGGLHTRENFWRLPSGVHADFHKVFSNMTPIEQIAYLILLFKKMYNPGFINEVVELIGSKDQNKYYKPGLILDSHITY